MIGLVAVTACSGVTAPTPRVPTSTEEPDLYVSVLEQVCDAGACGAGPLFVDSTGLDPAVAEALVAADGRVVVGPSSDDRLDEDGAVIDGGRILRFGRVTAVKPGVVAIDVYRTVSRFEGKGETFLFGWVDGSWGPADPVEAGVTVTTAVP